MKEYENALGKLVKSQFEDMVEVVDSGLNNFLRENHLGKKDKLNIVALFQAFYSFVEALETGSPVVKISEGTFMVQFFGPIMEKMLGSLHKDFKLWWGELSLHASTIERNLPKDQSPDDKSRAKIGQKTDLIGTLPYSEEILVVEVKASGVRLSSKKANEDSNKLREGMRHMLNYMIHNRYTNDLFVVGIQVVGECIRIMVMHHMDGLYYVRVYDKFLPPKNQWQVTNLKNFSTTDCIHKGTPPRMHTSYRDMQRCEVKRMEDEIE